MPGIGVSLRRRRSGSSWTPQAETTVYITGLTTPLSGSHVRDIDNFIVDIKSVMGVNDLESWVDLMYIKGGETEESALKNIARDAYHLTKTGLPTFTQFEGWAGASGKYLRTGYTPNTHKVRATLNDITEIVYITEPIAAGALELAYGVFSQTPNTLSQCSPSYGNKVGIALNGLNAEFNYKQNYSGFYIGTRLSATIARVYINYLKYNINSNSVGLPTREQYDLARNNVGNADAFFTKKVALYAKCKGMTETQVYGFMAAFEKYMKAKSKGVLGTSVGIIGDSISDIYTTTTVWACNFVQGVHTVADYAATSHSIAVHMALDSAYLTGDVYDKIIIALGTNDNDAGNMTTLQGVIESGIAAIKLACPSADIYYLNVLPRWTDAGGGTETPKGNIRAAIVAACAAQGITCWDTYTTPWIAPGDTADGIHPTTDGAVKVYNEVLSRIA